MIKPLALTARWRKPFLEGGTHYGASHVGRKALCALFGGELSRYGYGYCEAQAILSDAPSWIRWKSESIRVIAVDCWLCREPLALFTVAESCET